MWKRKKKIIFCFLCSSLALAAILVFCFSATHWTYRRSGDSFVQLVWLWLSIMWTPPSWNVYIYMCSVHTYRTPHHTYERSETVHSQPHASSSFISFSSCLGSRRVYRTVGRLVFPYIDRKMWFWAACALAIVWRIVIQLWTNWICILFLR